jgi:hypothetical protein
MAKDDSIKYNVVKEENILSAMKASGISTSASLKVAKNDSVVWDQTVVSIMERLDVDSLGALETDKEAVQKLSNHLKEIMVKVVLENDAIVIPEKGKNRDGKDFDVCDKEGMPKWSSWDQTRRIWDYIGSIAKIVAFGHAEILYPEQYKVASRCETLKLCKVQEVPLKAVERLTKQLQDVLDIIVPTDSLQAHKATSALSVNNLDIVVEMNDLVDRLDALLSVCTDDEKDDVKSHMNVLVKHLS